MWQWRNSISWEIRLRPRIVPNIILSPGYEYVPKAQSYRYAWINQRERIPYPSSEYFIDKDCSLGPKLTQLFTIALYLRQRRDIASADSGGRLTSKAIHLVLIVRTIRTSVAHCRSRYAAAVVAGEAVVVAFLTWTAGLFAIRCKIGRHVV